MDQNTKPLTDAQRRLMGEMIHAALCEIRMLGWGNKAEQAAALADAFHNLPVDMWHDHFNFQFFRDSFLSSYQSKYSGRCYRDYISMLDEIEAMKE